MGVISSTMLPDDDRPHAGMARPLLLRCHCSKKERAVLSALRAGMSGDRMRLRCELATLGIDDGSIAAFEALIDALDDSGEPFEAMQCCSPFVSIDELNLLAAVGKAATAIARGKQTRHALYAREAPFLHSCGAALHAAGVRMRWRTALHGLGGSSR